MTKASKDNIRHRLLLEMRKAGIKVTPETLQKAVYILSSVNPSAADAAEKLISELIWLRPTTTTTTPTREWAPASEYDRFKRAMFSDAATKALQDKLDAPNRPGGKVKPGPRWGTPYKPPNKVIVRRRKATKAELSKREDASTVASMAAFFRTMMETKE